MKTGTKIGIALGLSGAAAAAYFYFKGNPFASDEKKAEFLYNKYTKGFAKNQLDEMLARIGAMVVLREGSRLEAIKEVIKEIDSGNLPLPVANSS